MNTREGRERRAWHEAGHAVAFCVNNIGFVSLHLDTTPLVEGAAPAGGGVTWGSILHAAEYPHSLRYRCPTGEVTLRKWTMASLAGYCAEVMRSYEGGDPWATLLQDRGHGSDWRAAEALVATYLGIAGDDLRAYMLDSLRLAGACVIRHRAKVRAVALALLERGELTSAEVHRIVRAKPADQEAQD